MEQILEVIKNPVLFVPIIAWAISQITKFLINLIVEKKLDFKKMFSDGGMPSAHTATVSSLAVMVGYAEGFGSTIFALALVFAIVVMRDAVGVRRETGKQAASIKVLATAVNKAFADKNAEIRTENLKVLVGHTPIQVVFGALTGFLTALVYILISI